ncbi:cupin [uncultured Paracoccus sp.]|uniref:cupin n=1 Tax=uncultured Paracoccus sp. TaxID=189685 RepID=UPI0026092398|nr:cupin [uncultured Paracoccus sp.]
MSGADQTSGATGAVIHRGIAPTEGAAVEGPAALAAWFEARFAANGWTGAWRNGVFDWQHYHATTHEVLGCYAGSARIQLGGADGPVHEIATGDVVIIPAGVAHCNRGASADFAVVGAYPEGARPDMKTGDGAVVTGVARPPRDPVLGAGRGFARDA